MATKTIYKLDNERISSDSIVHEEKAGEYKNLKAILNEMKNQNVLWEGAVWMNASQTVNLSQKISEQRTGIVLIFSGYNSGGVARNWNHTCHFVPKAFLQFWNGGGVMIPMGGAGGVAGFKYIYIYDDRLEGNDNNASGDNTSYVLSHVIGV